MSCLLNFVVLHILIYSMRADVFVGVSCLILRCSSPFSLVTVNSFVIVDDICTSAVVLFPAMFHSVTWCLPPLFCGVYQLSSLVLVAMSLSCIVVLTPVLHGLPTIACHLVINIFTCRSPVPSRESWESVALW